MMIPVKRLLFALAAFAGLSLAKTLVIPIQGTIDGPLAVFLDRSLDRAEKEGASGVVLMIDTPGGRVDAAIKMSDRILATPLPTIAVVQNAFSAGALISLSAEQVYMLPGSEIGAALPITITPIINQIGAADRKVISALRAKFRAVAEARKRPANVVEAMVDPDIEIPKLTTKGEPLTLSAQKAVELKVADAGVASLREALEKAGFDPNSEEVIPGPQVGAARFLTSPTVAAVLLAVGVLGLVLEFFTPGTFVPATIGLIALGLYFAGGFLAGLSGTLQLILFFAGLLLILVELFVTPGFGFMGGMGIALLIASIYLTFGAESLTVGAYAILLMVAGLVLMFRLFPRTRIGKGLVLESAIGDSASSKSDLEALLGAIGTALTDLHPAGVARFGERRVDVVTQGEYISKNEAVRVIQVEGVRVVVRRES